ncbi:MAG: hypothetical protein A3A08_00655 [Candidatus Nealsonbacteria bacterium RIFCSPLOWO2_01_FULL_41_9]|uniref:Uncharacterized protein n=1 Tax=Candidatus Nealsonbacteria bacterium RIFCSPLOWO2_01_FULL_41_9 TaxID=1801671 RepID=A0A1G2EBW0_9BACT|nr:MAG: hypothetical protein A3A08_00655 [Candidatus Nealsonbacteria bacterium RIFCSPLOWO2_01_FULL_41_9]
MTINSATKTLGFILLAAGIILIGWTLNNSYNIFTGKSAPSEIFVMSEIKISSQPGGPDIQAQVQQMLAEQLKGMLPVNSVPRLLNMVIWSALAGILILGGAQIAGLGVKLIK